MAHFFSYFIQPPLLEAEEDKHAGACEPPANFYMHQSHYEKESHVLLRALKILDRAEAEPGLSVFATYQASDSTETENFKSRIKEKLLKISRVKKKLRNFISKSDIMKEYKVGDGVYIVICIACEN